MSFANGNANRVKPRIAMSKKASTTGQPSLDGCPKLTNESFGNAYQKGFPLTVRFLLSRGLTYEVALDTAQAAWTKGWERREQLRQPNCVLTWTNSIALNIYRTMCRRERPIEPLAEVAASTSLNVAAIDVERILKECQPNDRVLLEEHYIDGYKTTEIARLEGCSEMAVRIRLFRARRKIRRDFVIAKAGRPQPANSTPAALRALQKAQ
jgi:RNA polymerase sigma factor (sigma-70 family)